MEGSVVLSGKSVWSHPSPANVVALVHERLTARCNSFSVRCSGLPAETSGGICPLEGLCGDGFWPGELHPGALCLRAGGAEPEQHELQRDGTSHGSSDG